MALRELRDKPDYRAKFKLTDEMVRGGVVLPLLMHELGGLARLSATSP